MPTSILPAPVGAPEAALRRRVLLQVVVRNVANWSDPVLPLDDGAPDEWQILSKLALIAQGAMARRRPGDRRRSHHRGVVSAVTDEHGRLFDRDADESAALEPRVGPARVVDFMAAQRSIRRRVRRESRAG